MRNRFVLKITFIFRLNTKETRKNNNGNNNNTKTNFNKKNYGENTKLRQENGENI